MPAPRTFLALAASACAVASGAAPATSHATSFSGITTTHRLVEFSASDTVFRQPRQLQGLALTEKVAAIDVRPSTGGLYGIAQKGAVIRLVRIDQSTGALTQIGSPVTLSGTPSGVGMDFRNDDDIDVNASIDVALRINSDTGAVTVLSAPSPATPEFVAVAYPAGSTIGASIDALSNRLMLGNGSGTWIEPVHPLGVDVDGNTSLDFDVDGTAWMHASVGGANGGLYRVDIGSYFGQASEGPDLPAQLTGFAVRMSGDLAFAAPKFGVEEGGTAIVAIRRTAPADGRATVTWTAIDETATGGEDFTPTSGNVTFTPGETVVHVGLPVTDDAASEGTERVTVRLSGGDGLPLGPDAQVVIADNDAPATPSPSPSPGAGDPTPTPTASASPGATPGPSATPTPPGADTTKPILFTLPLKLKPARTLKLPFGLSENATTSVTLTVSAADAKRLKLKSRALAPAVRLNLKAGDGRATFKLAAATLKALRKRTKVIATAAITATDAAGNRAARSVKVTLAR